MLKLIPAVVAVTLAVMACSGGQGRPSSEHLISVEDVAGTITLVSSGYRRGCIDGLEMYGVEAETSRPVCNSLSESYADDFIMLLPGMDPEAVSVMDEMELAYFSGCNEGLLSFGRSDEDMVCLPLSEDYAEWFGQEKSR